MILAKRHIPVLCGHDPEAGKGGVLEYVARTEGYLRIALSLEGKYGVRARFYSPSDSLCEVNTEERESGIGHRVDQSF